MRVGRAAVVLPQHLKRDHHSRWVLPEYLYQNWTSRAQTHAVQSRRLVCRYCGMENSWSLPRQHFFIPLDRLEIP